MVYCFFRKYKQDNFEQTVLDYTSNKNICFNISHYISFMQFRHPPLAFYHLVEYICTLEFPNGITYKKTLKPVRKKHLTKLLSNHLINYKDHKPFKLLRIASDFNRCYNMVNKFHHKAFTVYHRSEYPINYMYMMKVLPLLMSEELKHYLRLMLKIIVHLGQFNITGNHKNCYFIELFFGRWYRRLRKRINGRCSKSIYNGNVIVEHTKRKPIKYLN